MHQRAQPNTSSPPGADPYTFERAIADLEVQRPLRNQRLKQIATDLADNRLQDAENALTEHLAKRPDDADAISLMARTQVRLGRRRQAASLLARCLELAPDFDLARFNYANLLFQLHKFDAALEEIDKLLRRDGRNPLYRQLKANILETTGANAEWTGPNEVRVDPFGQQTSRLSPTARLTIGKRVSDRVYLTFSRSLGATINDQIVLLEYEESDRLSWILSRNEDQQTYALEFRVRHSF